MCCIFHCACSSLLISTLFVRFLYRLLWILCIYYVAVEKFKFQAFVYCERLFLRSPCATLLDTVSKIYRFMGFLIGKSSKRKTEFFAKNTACTYCCYLSYSDVTVQLRFPLLKKSSDKDRSKIKKLIALKRNDYCILFCSVRPYIYLLVPIYSSSYAYFIY